VELRQGKVNIVRRKVEGISGIPACKHVRALLYYRTGNTGIIVVSWVRFLEKYKKKT